MKIRILGILGAMLLASPLANAQYVYTYTGANYDSFGSNPADLPGNPFTTAEHLTFQLTTSAPIPANLGNYKGSNQLDFQGVGFVSLTASNGIQSVTFPASEIQGDGAFTTPTILGFIVTNSAGNITNSYVFADSVSGKNYFTVSSDYPLPGQPSDATDMGPLSHYYGASSSGTGKWTFTAAPEIDPASAASNLTLLLIALSMARGGVRRCAEREPV
jgi:hypothetical protein